MTEKDFKKLLIDLDLSVTEIGQRVGISHTAVIFYLRGELSSPPTRARIKAVLTDRAADLNVSLPAFWEGAA